MRRKNTKANIALLAAMVLIVAAGLAAVGPLRAHLGTETAPVYAAAKSAGEMAELGCTVEIRCEEAAVQSLAEEKRALVPSDGVLLAEHTVAVEPGDTAFDVLRRACEQAGIALECSFTPLYGSYYVEGIGNLYEFDAGEQSGWLFSVNGDQPSMSSSAVTVAEGDAVVWRYVCTRVE